MFSMTKQFAVVLYLCAAAAMPAIAIPVSGTSTLGIISSAGQATFAPFYFRTQFQYDTNSFTKVDQGSFASYTFALSGISLSTTAYNTAPGSPLPLDSDFVAISGTGTGTVKIDRLFNSSGGPNTDRLQLDFQYQNAVVSPGLTLTGETISARALFNPAPGSNSSFFTVDPSGRVAIDWSMLSTSISAPPEVFFSNVFNRGFGTRVGFTGPTPINNVPLPATVLMLLFGGVFLVGFRRSRL
jgi:hypothetical protein